MVKQKSVKLLNVNAIAVTEMVIRFVQKEIDATKM